MALCIAGARGLAATLALSLLMGCRGATDEIVEPKLAPTLAATVNGVQYSSPAAAAVLSGAGNITIVAPPASGGVGITLQLFSIGTPGTYPLGVNSTVIGGAGQVLANFASFSTPNSGTAGSVTITGISLTRVSGRFNFVASRATGFNEAETRTVTDGRFDVAMTGTGTLQIPENVGSSIGGTVRGTSFVAGQVTLVQAPQSGLLQFEARQAGRVLLVEVSEFVGVGEYALGVGTGTARRLRLDDKVDDFPSTWGGSNANTAGRIIVTSVSASRVKGTLEAGLRPSFAPLNTPAAVVNVAFDIGLP